MSQPFDPIDGLIVVPARLCGPAGDTIARLALDTGAITSLISAEVLATIGIEAGGSAQRVKLITASTTESASLANVPRIDALGRTAAPFTVICHTLPAEASIDGLLGLDFLRGRRVSIDFRAGVVAVE